MQNQVLTDSIVAMRGAVAAKTFIAADKRETMPRGGYMFGASNPRLRPIVPKGE